MIKALVEPRPDLPGGWRIAELRPDGEEFPVAGPLQWIEAPNEATAEWAYDGANFAAPIPPPQPTKAERLAELVDRDKLIKAVLAREAAARGITLADLLAELRLYFD